MRLLPKSLNGRARRIVQNALWSLPLKGGSFALSILSIPVLLTYFQDNAVAGFWFTLMSVTSLLMSADFGLANGLRNRAAECLARGEISRCQVYVSSAYLTGMIIVAILIIPSILLILLVDWASVFNSPAQVDRFVAAACLSAVFLAILSQQVLKLVNGVIFAVERSAVTALLDLLANSSVVLFALFASGGTPTEKLLRISWFYVASSNLPLLFVSAFFYLGSLKHIRPTIPAIESQAALALLRLGGVFLLLQTLYVSIASVNSLLISRWIGSSAVVEYQAYSRIYLALTGLFALLVTPLWSPLGKAWASGDHSWVGRLYGRLCNLSLLYCGVLLSTPLWIGRFMEVWLRGHDVRIETGTLLIFSCSSCVVVATVMLSTVSNGLGIMRSQIPGLAAAAVLKVPISYVAYQYTDSWIWIAASDALALTPYCLRQSAVLRNLFRAREVRQHS